MAARAGSAAAVILTLKFSLFSVLVLSKILVLEQSHLKVCFLAALIQSHNLPQQMELAQLAWIVEVGISIFLSTFLPMLPQKLFIFQMLFKLLNVQLLRKIVITSKVVKLQF